MSDISLHWEENLQNKGNIKIMIPMVTLEEQNAISQGTEVLYKQSTKLKCLNIEYVGIL